MLILPQLYIVSSRSTFFVDQNLEESQIGIQIMKETSKIIIIIIIIKKRRVK